MTVIGELAVNVVAKTDRLNKGLRGARKQVSMFSKSMRTATAGLRGFTGAALGIGGGLSIAGLAISFKKTAESIDELAKTSRKLGIATEELAGLQVAAERTGVTIPTLNMALQRMSRRIGEAAKGAGEARGALSELGLDAKILAKQSPDVIFRKIAQAMSLQTDQTNKLALAQKLFDSEGVALVNTLALGEQGLAKYRREAELLGLTMSSKEAAKVEEFSDALGRLQGAFSGAGRQLTIKFAPGVTRTIDSIMSIMFKQEGMRPERRKSRDISALQKVFNPYKVMDARVRSLKDIMSDPLRSGEIVGEALGKEGRPLRQGEKMTPQAVKDLFRPIGQSKAGAATGGPGQSKKLIEWNKQAADEAKKQTKKLEDIDRIITETATSIRGGWPMPTTPRSPRMEAFLDAERVTIP